ncbi:DUF2849 domain-containing protein [Methylopila sp. Yamaguchi]|uniref:DUF2849 domain-containing protein n=1 Tax=Methylopila sp. Yamaguchi TaxID=1437817 RepID=UPI000CB8CD9F|nr:DUF2849 domain-containing protein [Methylopila sp. Yamaguchi]GBD50330.1 hypothetical protein METY_3543 [Methylopila sp. Yamaguchi]
MSAPIQKSAAKTKAATQIVTANRLSDGVVVYLAPDGGWIDRIDSALVAEGAEALAEAVAAGKRAEAAQEVVESYPIDVTREGGRLKPLRLREEIRAVGPTVRPDLLRPTGV